MSLKLCNAGIGKVTKVFFPTPAQTLKLRILARDFHLFIGIDPGVRTGFAAWDKKFKTLYVSTLQIHRALDDVIGRLQNFNAEDILVIVEDARQREYLPRERSNAEYRGKLMGAGSVKRDCTIWEDFLTDKKIPFQMLPPAAGRSKWSVQYFQSITKYKKPTSQHARDAAALVFGL